MANTLPVPAAASDWRTHQPRDHYLLLLRVLSWIAATILLNEADVSTKRCNAVVMEAYVHGVSTRGVDDLVNALGVSTGISKSEVSRICAGLDTEIAAFRERPLTHTEFP